MITLGIFSCKNSKGKADQRIQIPSKGFSLGMVEQDVQNRNTLATEIVDL